jgi:hypothetical protein
MLADHAAVLLVSKLPYPIRIGSLRSSGKTQVAPARTIFINKRAMAGGY